MQNVPDPRCLDCALGGKYLQNVVDMESCFLVLVKHNKDDACSISRDDVVNVL